jgi:hypothetical protein
MVEIVSNDGMSMAPEMKTVLDVESSRSLDSKVR